MSDVPKLTQEEVCHLIALRATKIASTASGARTCAPEHLRDVCKAILEDTERIVVLQAQLGAK